MKRMEIAPGVTRIELVPEEAGNFAPIGFSDAGGEYLRQTAFEAAARPVYRLSEAGTEGAVKQTANGEVVTFDDGERVLLRQSHSATLRFACGAGRSSQAWASTRTAFSIMPMGRSGSTSTT